MTACSVRPRSYTTEGDLGSLLGSLLRVVGAEFRLLWSSVGVVLAVVLTGSVFILPRLRIGPTQQRLDFTATAEGALNNDLCGAVLQFSWDRSAAKRICAASVSIVQSRTQSKFIFLSADYFDLVPRPTLQRPASSSTPVAVACRWGSSSSMRALASIWQLVARPGCKG